MREFREGSARPEKEEIDRRAIEDLQLILTNPLFSQGEKDVALKGAIDTWEKTEYPGENAEVNEHVEYVRRLAHIVSEVGFFENAIQILTNFIADLQATQQDEYSAICRADLEKIEAERLRQKAEAKVGSAIRIMQDSMHALEKGDIKPRFRQHRLTVLPGETEIGVSQKYEAPN